MAVAVAARGALPGVPVALVAAVEAARLNPFALSLRRAARRSQLAGVARAVRLPPGRTAAQLRSARSRHLAAAARETGKLQMCATRAALPLCRRPPWVCCPRVHETRSRMLRSRPLHPDKVGLALELHRRVGRAPQTMASRVERAERSLQVRAVAAVAQAQAEQAEQAEQVLLRAPESRVRQRQPIRAVAVEGAAPDPQPVESAGQADQANSLSCGGHKGASHVERTRLHHACQ